uniref:Death domain-containing protein n=1 Tax=Tetranychus urticae TaxID=32264 RepID=T1K6Y7_TETUR
MRFHEIVYGSNISLNKLRTQATRINDQCFCDGIIFSAKPIKLNQLVTLEIESFSTKWKGCLNVGLTCRDPLTFVKERPLPKYSYPVGLCSDDGVWIKPLPSHWNRSKVTFLLTGNTSSSGSSVQLYLVNSNETRYPFILALPSSMETSFWFIFDLYGRTTRLSVCDFNGMTFKIPTSITLQGPNVVRVYEKCCSKSSLKYNWTRVFTIGPPKSGKSTLKNILLNSSSQGIYLMVIDLSKDLDQTVATDDNFFQAEGAKDDYTALNLIHHWLSLIYSHVSNHVFIDDFRSTEELEDDEDAISNPKVIIIGTHGDSLSDQSTNLGEEEDGQNKLTPVEVFNRIEESLAGKVYRSIVHLKYFPIDCSSISDSQINEIRSAVDEIVLQQKLIDHDIPYSWIQFEQIIERLVRKGIHFVDINQIYELTKVHISDVKSMDVLQAILQFYHLSGRLYLFKSSYSTSNDMLIVLDPVWFANCFYQLCQVASSYDSVDCGRLSGILTDDTITEAWKEYLEHKTVLLGCLEKLDIICELNCGLDLDEPPDLTSLRLQPKVYLFPWIAQATRESDSLFTDPNAIALELINQFKFSISFNNILPIGLFSRLVVRLCRWSWRQGWGRRPEIWHSWARIAIDFDHDLILKVNLTQQRFFIIITKIYDTIGGESDPTVTGPAPNVCVKARHLIESELETLQNFYYRRIVYSLEVPCPCDLSCKDHMKKSCTEEQCLHFIPLNKCLSKKVVECDYRQIRTNFVQKYFPVLPYYASASGQYSGITDDSALSLYEHPYINTYEDIFRLEPLWMRDAAKMLINSSPGRDWLALARRLGYTDKDVARLVDDVSPSLALIHDWFESNGRTRYCIDVLMSCLQMISREDVRQIIEVDLQPIGSAPPVFLSYQWDSQKLVLDLRRRLEMAGFPCWMDIGLMGGGDSLYGKIYEGISKARVIIACLTPRYASSRICAREVTLADVLRKPILPVMLEPTPWPPPGPMAVVMSSLVFVDLCGVGGHGGIGKSGDSETRFRDILNTISRCIAGNPDAAIPSRNQTLQHLFYPRSGDPRLSLTTITPDLRSDSPPLPQERPTTSGEAEEIADYYAMERTVEQASGDEMSVVSRLTNNPNNNNNRISNCSICNIV